MTPALPQALAFWLMGGAVLATVLRGIRTNGQGVRETVLDSFLSVVFAVAWCAPIPGVSAIWPPVDLTRIPAWMAGVLFAGVIYIFFDYGKAWIQKKAPELFAKYTGQSTDGDKKP